MNFLCRTHSLANGILNPVHDIELRARYMCILFLDYNFKMSPHVSANANRFLFLSLGKVLIDIPALISCVLFDSRIHDLSMRPYVVVYLYIQST